MNRYLAGFLVIAALGGSASAADQADADLQKLLGTWNLTSVEIQGRTIAAPEGGGTFIFSKGNKVVMKEKGKPDKDGSFTIDASKSPKELDLVGPKEKDKEKEVVHAIYHLEGDTLKLAYPIEGPKGKRPTAFDSKKAMIMILKRQKP